MANLTAHQMLLKGIRMAGESDSNATLLALYNEPFLAGANLAYGDIWQRQGMVMWDDVTLDANKEFDLTDLTYDVKRIIRITQYIECSAASGHSRQGGYIPFPVSQNGFVVPAATASTVVYVLYKPIPTPIINTYPVISGEHAAGSDATSPAYVPALYVNAMIYKGMAEVRSMQRDMDDMDKWEGKYFQAVSGIQTIRKPIVRDAMEY
jgi:hypothetical protein